MRWKELIGQLWRSHRNSLVMLGILLLLNLLLIVALERFVAPRVAERESTFLRRQTEVRQLLRNQGGATNTPEQAYLMAAQDLDKFYQSIPDYQEFTGLVEELLVLSNRARLNITRISYHSAQLKESELLKLELNFNVEGDYDQIKRFIHSLEQSARLIAIKQIGLEGADDKSVNLRLKLETFFRSGGRET
ncbi:MAG: type 4a pilus biogenesis protein PilO [Gammaproteobacteria bacterium]|nr:type 4a pilus biogenesis protein PilO [Gammaproteobacteria bacterium]